MEAPLKDCTTLEQRAVIRFLNAEGIQTYQICQRIKNIYGESCLSQKNIYKWVNEFKNGRIICTDIERPGRPSVTATTSTINAVENLILEDRKISIFTIGNNTHTHPAYSPDLAPSDLFLFGLLKKELKGKRFDSDEDVQKVVQDFFHTLPKSAYKEGIYKFPERWRRCIESQALSRSRTFEWLLSFLKGREKVNDDQHTGRPRSLRCEKNKLKKEELIKYNRRFSIKDLSSETGLSVGLCLQIVTKDLDMIRTSSKFVPRILTEEQKEVRMDVCKNMVEMTRTDPEWMQKIITGDETWVYQYDPETKRQSSQWIERGESKPKKARFTKSKVKTLLVTFFYINGLVHHEFIPLGRTINQEVYLGITRRLREGVRLKRPERWQKDYWILHVDNARPRTAHVILQFLAKHSNIQIPHAPYSPDSAPNDFFFYPKLKMKLKGRKFDNVDMIQAKSKATLRNLSKSDFISCFDNWNKRWKNRCIEAGGAYFEKY
ncbi:hypothetical protein LAZ67_15001841 [Cordylochernes scorpioides]|uniref:Transposase n=1 Tax=Cordylochernes scorpioides TaxID=51811 RepID=A0ABY6LA81_9ARAC|nr:hypothetical protein LAZ67_15001841 [Cordylochernes scorpioides]